MSWYREGVFWLDRNCVKAFTRGGQQVSLYRVSVDDDLNVSLSKHKQNIDGLEFESWNDTIVRMTPHIQDIETASIALLRSKCKNCGRKIINTNSTGKDSMVVTCLAEKAGLDFETYFNVTTLDVKESNRMAKRHGYKHILPNPKYGGFYKYICQYEGMIPSRLNRFCCQYFKENPTVDYFDSSERLLFLFGMRNQESAARAGYQDEWKNEKWGNRDWIAILPIRTWSDFDVWLYTLYSGIDINEKYKYGYDRVGCGIACPNYTKYTWVLDQYWYPVMFQRWRDILRKDFISQNKWLIMNCTVDEYVTRAWNGGVYRAEPTEEVVREYAEHAGLDIEIARKYFNRYCANGCLNKRRTPLKIKDRNTIAMNMKMYGREVNNFLCKKCLLKEFHWDSEQWDEMVDDFKSQGCKLF